MLDIILLIILVIYFFSGINRGFFVSLGSLLGFILGALAAFWVTPWVVSQVSTGWYVIAAILSLLICIITGQWVGFLMGRAIRRVSDVTPLRGLERAAGGLLNLFVCAFVIVLVVLTVRPLGIPQISRALGDSTVVSTLLRLTPDPFEDRVNELRSDVIDSGAIPEVTQLLYPSESAPTEELSTAALEEASRSVVQILGNADACYYTSEGSGFVAANDYVVTNAHVVTGVSEPVVQDRAGNSTSGQVVYYDTAQDLAIIHAPGVGLNPLPIGTDVPAGTTVSFMGYPKGGPFKNRSATVQGLGTTQTVNSSTGETSSRLVYQLAANVEQGNSGGPVLNENGEVIGVIFAKATQGQTGYAIPSLVLQQALSGLASYTEQVYTGQCSP